MGKLVGLKVSNRVPKAGKSLRLRGYRVPRPLIFRPCFVTHIRVRRFHAMLQLKMHDRRASIES